MVRTRASVRSSPSLSPSHSRCRTSWSSTVCDSFTSMATARPSPRSTIRSASRSPPLVRKWKTCASADWAKTRTQSVASDSKRAPRNVPSRGIAVGPSPCRSAPASTPERRAASAGSARWCFGAPTRRWRWLRVGAQAGTGSRTQRRSRASRYGMVVVFAGLASSPLVAASRILSYEAVVEVADHVGADPPSQRVRVTDLDTEFEQVDVDDALEVAVEGGPLGPGVREAHAGEPAGQDLSRVVLECYRRRSLEAGPPSGEEGAERHGRGFHTPLAERQGPHAEGHDPPRPRVGRPCCRRRRPGEDEPSRPGVVIDRPADEVPRGRIALPLVDHHRRDPSRQPGGLGMDDLEDGWVVQSDQRAATAAGRRGLP